MLLSASELKSILKIPKTGSDNNFQRTNVREAKLYLSMMKREYCLLAALLTFSSARLEHVIEILKNFEQRYVVVKAVSPAIEPNTSPRVTNTSIGYTFPSSFLSNCEDSILDFRWEP